MGFTRSTTTTNVHQSMPDYPSNEGYTASQLKIAFDSPAEGIQNDLNGLMGELEQTSSASFIGATAISAGDDSDENVQSKLEYIMEELQGVALGDIPDGTITQSKLNDDYEATLAKKDGTLQTGLDAEKLGGSTLAAIETLITATSHEINTFTNNNQTSVTLSLGFQPTFLVYLATDLSSSQTTNFPAIGIVIGGNQVYWDLSVNKWKKTSATLSTGGITLQGFPSGYNKTYSYVVFR